MNAELVRIRDNLICGHCAAIFRGSDSQARHVKYEQCKAYCSDACRHAALRKKFSKPVPDRGPCKHCGQMFRSRRAKQYCSLGCYTQSDAFRRHTIEIQKKSLTPEARAKQAASARTGEFGECLECGGAIYKIRSHPKKFCSQTCYRAYMAKRFDRWIANPMEMALPQCYDEFMDSEELPCLLEGCDWQGHHLGLHVNLAHGLSADDFKRASGFNKGTGLVGSKLHKRLVETNADKGSVERIIPAGQLFDRSKIKYYWSLEAREHQAKSRALSGNGPKRQCAGCGIFFQQSTPFGWTKYCTIECRTLSYAWGRRSCAEAVKQRKRDALGRFA